MDFKLDIPIIQGGMGIGISLGRLAGNVALCGGMGVISTVNAGYMENDFEENHVEANLRALRREIKKAFEIAKGKGKIAINQMVAVNHYEESVKEAVKAGIDAVISGAGLPLELPKYTKDTPTAAAPIVSSGKAASVIMKSWDRHYGVTPDFIVIEGVKAGGHLGFAREDVIGGTAKPLEYILKEVLEKIEPYRQKYGRDIPVFVAGGIFDGNDMAHFMNLGAAGVQMATRFIATEECDASTEFKDRIVNATSDEVTIVQSPVGLPGRALNEGIIKRLGKGETFPPVRCNDCLKTCPHGIKAPYCISRALIEAVKGNISEGLLFAGENVDRVKSITTVKKLMDELVSEWRKLK